jgi:hypothetical protein
MILFSRNDRASRAQAGPLGSLTAFVLGMAFVMWSLLLTGFEPAHDALHTLRHALYFIPCH